MDITEKVDNLLEELIYCDFRTEVGIDRAKQKIRLALKRQDRDTRHACAEQVVTGSFWSDAADANVVRSDFAHSAVMNCREGLTHAG